MMLDAALDQERHAVPVLAAVSLTKHSAAGAGSPRRVIEGNLPTDPEHSVDGLMELAKAESKERALACAGQVACWIHYHPD